jgi:GAF domain-containing protein
MTPMFDIFRVVDGAVRWLQSAGDFDSARSRVMELGADAPGEYIIFDHTVGLKTPILIGAAEERSSRSPVSRSTAESVLVAAMELVGADLGNVQILDRATTSLRIVAQKGFSPQFLTFFDTVDCGGSACGAAWQRGKRVIINDVKTDPVYAKEAREVMLAEGIRSLQSIPLFAGSQMIGMLSLQYRTPNTAKKVHLRISDRLASEFAQQIAHEFSS